MHASQLRKISSISLVRNSAHGKNVSDTRGSDFLWEAAEQEKRKEETMTNPSGGTPSSNSYNAAVKAAQEYPNWTGDESVQDAVLRMLVDKYKPLRGGSIRTAEEKIKEDLKPNAHFTTASIPLEDIPSDSNVQVIYNTSPHFPSSPSASPPPSGPGTHKPWLTTFRPPSRLASVKYMRSPPPLLPARSSSKDPSVPNPDDTRSKMMERDKKKKALLAGRLTNAKEASLDYRLGKTSFTRPNPVSLKGWYSLVEERIERAKNEGVFRTIKGRGKPLTRDNEETNPFISREDFLMNRIVQRQGAAPPWVEFQRELESAITTFRNVLKSTWIRRAIRTFTTTNHPVFLSSITLADITRLRDLEWEKKEQGYHEQSLKEINSLVTKYNGVAPYAVRKSPLDRRIELERMYEECKEEILEEIKRRASDVGKAQSRGFNEAEHDRDGGVDAGFGNHDLDLHGSGRITQYRSMFNWWGIWSRLVSLVGGKFM